MQGPGIISTVRLAATLVFAVPAALFGLDQILGGRPVIGGTFLLFAVLLLVMERRLFNPFDPGEVAESAAERVGDALVDDE